MKNRRKTRKICAKSKYTVNVTQTVTDDSLARGARTADSAVIPRRQWLGLRPSWGSRRSRQLCAWCPSPSRMSSRRETRSRSGHLLLFDAADVRAPCSNTLRSRDSHSRGTPIARVRFAKWDCRDDWWQKRDPSRHLAIQRARNGTAQCHGVARSGAAVVHHRIVAFATRLGQTVIWHAATKRVHECDREVNTSRQQESSSNCASSAADETTSRRPRTTRVVRALSRQDPTEQRASESNARDCRERLCMRAIATRLCHRHGVRRSSEARSVRDREYVLAGVQIWERRVCICVCRIHRIASSVVPRGSRRYLRMSAAGDWCLRESSDLESASRALAVLTYPLACSAVCRAFRLPQCFAPSR